MDFYQFPNSNFSLENLNAPQSNYAQDYNKQQTKLIQNLIVKKLIEAAPEEYLDFKLLAGMMLKSDEIIGSDEITWFEVPYQREAIKTQPIGGGGIAAANSYTVPIANINKITVNRKLSYYGSNIKATVIAVNPSAGTITLKAKTGGTLPALTAATTYYFAHDGSVDGDGVVNPEGNQRLNGLRECYNFIQLYLSKAIFGRVELIKWEQNSTTNYIEVQYKKLIEDYMMSVANDFWNGERAEMTLSDGTNVKTTDGVNPWLTRNSAFSVSSTPANLLTALKSVHFNTRFGSGNYTRYVFATPQNIDAVAAAYKLPLVRFNAKADVDVDLELDSISFGSGRLVFCSVQRFEKKSGSFPDFFQDRMFVLDIKKITPMRLLGYPEYMGEVGARNTNKNTMSNNLIKYMEGSAGYRLEVAGAHGWVDVLN